MQEIRERITTLESRVDAGDAKVLKLGARVEGQERHSRQLNQRVYGFKAKEEGGAYRDPKPLFYDLLTTGLQIPPGQADRIVPARIHWAGKGAYLIITFASTANLSLVKTNRKNLANYKPDGAPISLRDDFTAEQQPAVQLVDKIVSALRKKSVQVASAGLFVRHDKRNYKPEDPHVQELLQLHNIVIVQEAQVSTRIVVASAP